MHRAAAAIVMTASMAANTAASNGDAGFRPPEHILTITYRVGDDGGLGLRVVAAAMDEARALWAPYGVMLVPASDDQIQACLMINIDNELPTPNPGAGSPFTLGTIDFAPSGRPEHQIHVAIASIRELFRQDEAHGHYEAGSEALSQYVLARTVGRVIAHEVGHFILQFPSHVTAGLMAASHSTVDLASFTRRPFALTPMLEPRLRQSLERGACDCQEDRTDDTVTPVPTAPACAEQ